jgi:hypothetical protein
VGLNIEILKNNYKKIHYGFRLAYTSEGISALGGVRAFEAPKVAADAK